MLRLRNVTFVASVFVVALLIGSFASDALATGPNQWCDTSSYDSCQANCNPDMTGVCGGRVCNSSSPLTAGCVSWPFYNCRGIECPGTCAGVPAFACRCQTTGQGC